MLLAFVLLDLVSSVLAKGSAGKNVSAMTLESLVPWHQPAVHFTTTWALSPSWATPLPRSGSGVVCAEHRAPPIFGRAAIMLGIGPHSSSLQ